MADVDIEDAGEPAHRAGIVVRQAPEIPGDGLKPAGENKVKGGPDQRQRGHADKPHLPKTPRETPTQDGGDERRRNPRGGLEQAGGGRRRKRQPKGAAPKGEKRDEQQTVNAPVGHEIEEAGQGRRGDQQKRGLQTREVAAQHLPRRDEKEEEGRLPQVHAPEKTVKRRAVGRHPLRQQAMRRTVNAVRRETGGQGQQAHLRPKVIVDVIVEHAAGIDQQAHAQRHADGKEKPLQDAQVPGQEAEGQRRHPHHAGRPRQPHGQREEHEQERQGRPPPGRLRGLLGGAHHWK